MPESRELFEPAGLLQRLGDAGVSFVVVGAFAGVMHGFPLDTLDLDLTPELDEANLERLAIVLHENGATIRIKPHTPGPVDLPPDGRLLARAPILNLHLPRLGDVDVIHRAAASGAEDGGPLDYAHMGPVAVELAVPRSSLKARAMSEAHWLAAKRADPVRAKDAVHLQVYREWRSRS